MSEKFPSEALRIMDERFGCDSLIALATSVNGMPYVRAVNSFYTDGSFYVVTYALSSKIQQIADNPTVAICGDWFTGHGVGENIGHILAPENENIADKLRTVFAEWYGNGHVNEADPNTCILRIRMTHGILMSHGTRYEIDFTTAA